MATSAGPAINPGTVQAHLPEFYEKGKIYDVKKLRNRDWFIHAPCVVNDIHEDKDAVTFIADGWGDKPYYVLISGVEQEPTEVLVRKISQQSSEQASVKRVKIVFNAKDRRLIINLQGKSQIRIKY